MMKNILSILLCYCPVLFSAVMHEVDTPISSEHTVSAIRHHRKHHHHGKKWLRKRAARARTQAQRNLAMVPPSVFAVLDYIEKNNGRAPNGFVGGRTFGNYDRILPGPMIYREYDVHPLEHGKNRGAQRMVRGQDGSAWYTADHYRTFIRIK